MKTVITMVGTSLMTNHISENNNSKLLKDLYEKYKHKPASEYELNKEDITRLKKKLIQFAEANKQASAEIKSLEKLSKEITDNLSIQLLSSDTINSRICAEVIKDVLDGSLDVHFTNNNIIKGLQVKNRKSFAEDGMENLFKRIEGIITGGYYEDAIMNITGGYKAAIPLLTIFSQINHIPSYYIFEDTDALMKIPLLPLSIDWDIFDKYADIFHEVEKSGGCVENWNTIASRIKNEYRATINACFEIDDNDADLSTFGRLLWKKYNDGRYLFYLNESVKSALKNDSDSKKYLTKLFDANFVQTKTENKNNHFVLDLGRTAPRIFYRQKDGYFYIYKYTRHDNEYERFINSNLFSSLDDYGPFEMHTLKK